MRDEEIPHLTHTNFQARELRAIASYLAFHHNYSLKRVIGMATWRNNISLFLLLGDLPLAGDGTAMNPFVAGLKVIPRRALSKKSFPEDIWVMVNVVVVC